MELLSGFDDVTSQRQYVIIGKEFLLTSIHRKMGNAYGYCGRMPFTETHDTLAYKDYLESTLIGIKTKQSVQVVFVTHRLSS